MPWPEPLVASSRDESRTMRVIELRDGAGDLVLSVPVKHWPTGSSLLCEIVAHKKDAAARQRLRAFSLLIREALRWAKEAGIAHGHADVADHMNPIAEAVATTTRRAGNRFVWDGSIDELAALVELNTDELGNLRRAPADTADRVIEAIDRGPTTREAAPDADR